MMRSGISILPGVRLWFMAFVCACVCMNSCVTQRRCIEKFPPVVTVDTVETILWIDTTIYVKLPGDTVVDSILVEVEPDYVSDVVNIKSEYGSARAWIENERLRLRLTINDTLIAYRIDSLALVNTKTITVEKERIVEVKNIPVFYKAVLWVSIFLFILVLCLFYLSLRKR